MKKLRSETAGACPKRTAGGARSGRETNDWTPARLAGDSHGPARAWPGRYVAYPMAARPAAAAPADPAAARNRRRDHRLTGAASGGAGVGSRGWCGAGLEGSVFTVKSYI